MKEMSMEIPQEKVRELNQQILSSLKSDPEFVTKENLQNLKTEILEDVYVLKTSEKSDEDQGSKKKTSSKK